MKENFLSWYIFLATYSCTAANVSTPTRTATNTYKNIHKSTWVNNWKKLLMMAITYYMLCECLMNKKNFHETSKHIWYQKSRWQRSFRRVHSLCFRENWTLNDFITNFVHCSFLKSRENMNIDILTNREKSFNKMINRKKKRTLVADVRVLSKIY